MSKKKKNLKSAQEAATFDDDDFDQMLAEVTAADPQLPVNDPTKMAKSSSSSSSSSSTANNWSTSRPNATISEEVIVAACQMAASLSFVGWNGRALDLDWTDKNGAAALYLVAQEGKICVARCLVNELGADIDQAANNGVTPFVAAQEGNLDAVRCVVKNSAQTSTNQGKIESPIS
jgi:hypothetical protein